MDVQRVERPEVDKLIVNRCIRTSQAQRVSCEEMRGSVNMFMTKVVVGVLSETMTS